MALMNLGMGAPVFAPERQASTQVQTGDERQAAYGAWVQDQQEKLNRARDRAKQERQAATLQTQAEGAVGSAILNRNPALLAQGQAINRDFASDPWQGQLNSFQTQVGDLAKNAIHNGSWSSFNDPGAASAVNAYQSFTTANPGYKGGANSFANAKQGFATGQADFTATNQALEQAGNVANSAYAAQTGFGFSGGLLNDDYNQSFFGQVTDKAPAANMGMGQEQPQNYAWTPASMMGGNGASTANNWTVPGMGGFGGGQPSNAGQPTQPGWGGPFTNKNAWSLG